MTFCGTNRAHKPRLHRCRTRQRFLPWGPDGSAWGPGSGVGFPLRLVASFLLVSSPPARIMGFKTQAYVLAAKDAPFVLQDIEVGPPLESACDTRGAHIPSTAARRTRGQRGAGEDQGVWLCVLTSCEAYSRHLTSPHFTTSCSVPHGPCHPEWRFPFAIPDRRRSRGLWSDCQGRIRCHARRRGRLRPSVLQLLRRVLVLPCKSGFLKPELF